MKKKHEVKAWGTVDDVGELMIFNMCYKKKDAEDMKKELSGFCDIKIVRVTITW